MIVYRERIKPVTEEQVFYDKFLCDKFYLLVCTRNFDNFFYDKCTFVIEEIVNKVQILFVCIWVNKENLSK
jgi:hypothetical protein